ncbi:hypothetical protein MMPV_004507 [Pyropia vietnamensis]
MLPGHPPPAVVGTGAPSPTPTAESVNAVADFLATATATLLCTRAVYPRCLFTRVLAEGVPAYAARHPALADYLTAVAGACRPLLAEDLLERYVVAIVADTPSGGRGGGGERGGEGEAGDPGDPAEARGGRGDGDGVGGTVGGGVGTPAAVRPVTTVLARYVFEPLVKTTAGDSGAAGSDSRRGDPPGGSVHPMVARLAVQLRAHLVRLTGSQWGSLVPGAAAPIAAAATNRSGVDDGSGGDNEGPADRPAWPRLDGQPDVDAALMSPCRFEVVVYTRGVSTDDVWVPADGCERREFAPGEYAVEPLKDADPTAEVVELTSYVERRLPQRVG